LENLSHLKTKAIDAHIAGLETKLQDRSQEFRERAIRFLNGCQSRGHTSSSVLNLVDTYQVDIKKLEIKHFEKKKVSSEYALTLLNLKLRKQIEIIE
jgi:hypothetical protein